MVLRWESQQYQRLKNTQKTIQKIFDLSEEELNYEWRAQVKKVHHQMQDIALEGKYGPLVRKQKWADWLWLENKPNENEKNQIRVST
jgi:hypothetical protein